MAKEAQPDPRLEMSGIIMAAGVSAQGAAAEIHHQLRSREPGSWSTLLDNAIADAPAATGEYIAGMHSDTEEDMHSKRTQNVIIGSFMASLISPLVTRELQTKIDTRIQSGSEHTIKPEVFEALPQALISDQRTPTDDAVKAFVWALNKIPKDKVGPELIADASDITAHRAKAALPKLVMEGYVDLCAPFDDIIHGHAEAKAKQEFNVGSIGRHTAMLLQKDASAPDLDDRNRYIASRGFAYTTNIANQLAGEVATYVPRKIDKDAISIEWRDYRRGKYTKGHSIALAMLSAREVFDTRSSTDLADQFGEGERHTNWSGKYYTFRGGLGDMDFTHHFATALAHEVTEAFVACKELTKRQRDQLTLTDYAELMRTPWFSAMLHDAAFTRNGFYGGFGLHPDDYQPGALQRLISDKGSSHGSLKHQGVFTIENRTAALSPEAKKMLRGQLGHGSDRSPGCPAARHTATFSKHSAEHDAHLQQLIARGDVQVQPAYSKVNRVRVTQETTAIDRMLYVLAGHLERYDQKYGTPTISRPRFGRDKQSIITHEKQPALHIFAPEPHA